MFSLAGRPFFNTSESQTLAQFSSSPRSSLPARRPAFTLVELLVSIGILALLISMLMPMLAKARLKAKETVCKSNLNQLGTALRMSLTSRPHIGPFPPSGAWMDFVIDQKCQKVLKCPLDTYVTPGTGGLSGYYLVQNGTTFSYLTDVQGAADSALRGYDDQLHRIQNGAYGGNFGESGKTWPEKAWGSTVASPNWECGFDDDAGMVIAQENGGTVFHSLDAPGDGTKCWSEHYLCKGEAGRSGGKGWDSEVVMRLTGRDHADIIDPPVTAGGSPSSYGMNSLVQGNMPRNSQILLVEYGGPVVRVAAAGNTMDDFNGTSGFAPRHEDRANILYVNGSVQSVTRTDVNPDLSANFIKWWQ